MKRPYLSDKKKLQQLIKEAHFSPTKIANAIGVTYKTVYRWLNRKIQPHPLLSKAIDGLFKEHIDLTPYIFAVKKQFKKSPLSVFKRNKSARERFFLAMTYYSNALSGIEMTLKETKEIIRGEIIKGKTLQEHLAVVNHYNALRYMLECLRPNFKITEKYILNLHSILMYNFSSNLPGKYMKREFTLKMRKLLCVISKPCPQAEIIKKIAMNYHNFVNIHPFADANGRIARLIMATQLLSNGLAPAIMTTDCKNKYYAACSKAYAGDCRPLIQLTGEAILKGYEL